MLFLLVSYSPLARRQVRASIYPVSRASAWLVVAAPAPPKPTKTREFAARQETAAKTLKVLNSLGLRASRAMATVVESEEVKTDEEKAVKKVVEEENEPESAGGCDVCLPLLFGVFGKLGAAFNSIPICVVGGLVLQCFASDQCINQTSRRSASS